MLLIAILFGVAFSNVMRWAQGCRRKMLWVGTIAYAVGATGAAISGLGVTHAPIGLREAGYGVVGGLAWVGAYLAFNAGIRLAGVGITQCVSWLAVTVPVVAAILAWGEVPAPLQWWGLGAVGVALVLLLPEQPKGAAAPNKLRIPVLAAAFVGEGLTSLAMKAYTRSAPGVADDGLLLFMFGTGAAALAVAAACAEGRPGVGEVRHGVVLGLTAIVANLAFMAAVRQLPAPVMLPSFWAGSVVLTALAARLLWGERYRTRALAGMGVALAGMVLLHTKLS